MAIENTNKIICLELCRFSITGQLYKDLQYSSILLFRCVEKDASAAFQSR